MRPDLDTLLSAGVVAAIARFRAALERRFGGRLKELRLYGSYARGEAWEESDIDLLVLVDGVDYSERMEIYGLAWEAGRAEDEWYILSPLVRTPEEFETLRRQERRIAADIDREGISL